MEDTMIPTCEHLELIPQEEEKQMVISILGKLKKCSGNSKWRACYIEKLMGHNRAYEPYCRLREETCVVVKSHLKSQKKYGFGKYYQTIDTTIGNSRRIEDCSDRKVSERAPQGLESITEFLLTHIKAD